ncbi:MAG: hypothetical protein P4L82_14470 [Ancalomicrobiaceae bacterium]|nr:hypothetical protein [Ancalomicrobiaceae bacterium]
MIEPRAAERREEEDIRRPPLWSLVPILILPFIPVAVAIAAYRLGLSHGCSSPNVQACVVHGFDLADVIQIAMTAAWLAVFGAIAPALAATDVVHKAMEGFSPRFVFGGLLPAGTIVGTVVAAMIAVAILKPEGCSLADPGRACTVFGKDMSHVFALAGIAPWPLVFAVVPAAAYVVVYAIVLGVDELARNSRSRLAARTAEAVARQAGHPLADKPGASRSDRPARRPLVYIPPKRR